MSKNEDKRYKSNATADGPARRTHRIRNSQHPRQSCALRVAPPAPRPPPLQLYERDRTAHKNELALQTPCKAAAAVARQPPRVPHASKLEARNRATKLVMCDRCGHRPPQVRHPRRPRAERALAVHMIVVVRTLAAHEMPWQVGRRRLVAGPRVPRTARPIGPRAAPFTPRHGGARRRAQVRGWCVVRQWLLEGRAAILLRALDGAELELRGRPAPVDAHTGAKAAKVLRLRRADAAELHGVRGRASEAMFAAARTRPSECVGAVSGGGGTRAAF